MAIKEEKKYEMAVIPFCYVPFNCAFRYNKNWYIRENGTVSKATKFKFVKEDLVILELIPFYDYVVVAKNRISKKYYHTIISSFNIKPYKIKD